MCRKSAVPPLKLVLCSFEDVLKIRIEGCSELNKVMMSKAIKVNSDLGLKQSKAFTDKLLDEGFVVIETSENWDESTLITALKSANANIVSVE